MKLFVALLLVSIAVGASATGNGDELATCDHQAPCFSVSITPTDLNICTQDPEPCEVRVCIHIDLSADGCNINNPGSKTISHLCVFGGDTTNEAETCVPNPLTFVGTSSEIQNIADGATHCVLVSAGDSAPFVFKDGAGGVCSDGPDITNPSGFPIGTTCRATTSADYDKQGFDSCTGQGNAGKECIWTIPTDPQICGDLNDPPPPPPPPNGVSGDPHFRTWTGDKFSYHGACDMVLLHSDSFGNGLGMDIHIRTKHIREFSYVTSAALRIGDDVLEVTGKGELYYLNGIANAELPSTVGGYKVTRKQVSDFQQTFLVHLDKQTVVIKTWKSFVSVKIEHASVHDFGDSVGLMGSFETGAMLARDGTTVLDDANAFGQEWQVRSDELKLFQTLKMPQYPQACILPPKSSVERRRRLGEAAVTEEAAAKACQHVPPADLDFCVYDVLATGDVSMAGAY